MGKTRQVRGPNFLVGSGLALLIAFLLLIAADSVALAAPYPVLPQQSYTQFLSGLAVGPLSPGNSGTLSFDVYDPLETPINTTVVTFAFYAFNPYPGNAPGSLPTTNAVAFVPLAGGPLRENTSFALGSLGPGETVPGSVSVQAPVAAPAGSYAVRTSLQFMVGPTTYLLESRGFFSDAQWANATESPNGNATLNVSRLGVSGVTPETAVVVQSSSASYFIWGLLAVSLVLAGLAAFYAFRRGPRSKSGARGEASPQRAPSALGNKRTKDGD